MKQSTLVWLATLGSFAIGNTVAMAASSAGTEMGFAVRYESLKSPNYVYAQQAFQGYYLKPYKAVWLGGELTYASLTNASYATKIMEVGGLIKYWIMAPGQGFSFNLLTGFSFGKSDDGFDNSSVMAIKAGPEFAYFVMDDVSVTTRLQYTMRKSGESYNGLGLFSGFSVFF